MLTCEVCRENGQEGKITSNLGMEPTDSCWGQEIMKLSFIYLLSSCMKANKTLFSEQPRAFAAAQWSHEGSRLI